MLPPKLGERTLTKTVTLQLLSALDLRQREVCDPSVVHLNVVPIVFHIQYVIFNSVKLSKGLLLRVATEGLGMLLIERRSPTRVLIASLPCK